MISKKHAQLKIAVGTPLKPRLEWRSRCELGLLLEQTDHDEVFDHEFSFDSAQGSPSAPLRGLLRHH